MKQNQIKIKIHAKFKPLFAEKTRYYIVTGGRGSGKSFAVSLYLTLKLFAENQKILFTRYTLTAAKDSIIPEFTQKIDLLNEENNFDIQLQDIENKASKSAILFRGIKAGSGIQTAKLKSLTDVNVWVLDEAEELTDEAVFNKINLSIRTNKTKNIVILVLNPSYRSHWIYQKFFKNADVPELFNGIKDNVTYIHTNYKENIENLDGVFLSEAAEIKEKNKQRYNEDYLGYWKDEPEGIVFDRNKLQRFNRADIVGQSGTRIAHIDVADQGNDSLCYIVAEIIGKKIFITDVIHSKEGERVTRPKIVENCNETNVSLCMVESNNQGTLFNKMLIERAAEEKCNTQFIGYPQQSNKEGRIIAQSQYVYQYVYFLADIDFKHGSYYDLFLKELTSYNSDGKNVNDDAPDSLAGLIKFLRVKKLV